MSLDDTYSGQTMTPVRFRLNGHRSKFKPKGGPPPDQMELTLFRGGLVTEGGNPRDKEECKLIPKSLNRI